jgi:hypothetical protein
MTLELHVCNLVCRYLGYKHIILYGMFLYDNSYKHEDGANLRLYFKKM